MNEINAVGKEKILTRDFLLICSANFFLFLGFQMTLPTIPLFVKSLGGSDQIIGLVVGFFTFSALIARSFAGNALETKGRRFVYIFGLSMFVFAIGSYAFVSSLAFLFFIRIFQGTGWGFSGTASGTIASDLIPSSRRGEGMGLYALGSNMALAVGPAIALSLNQIIDFRQIFLLCAFCGVISIILASQIRYKKVEPTSAKKSKTEKRVFFEKAVWQPSLLLFFVTFTFGGIASFLPLYTKEQGVGGIELYFTCYALALLATRFFAGKVYDRKGLSFIFVPGIFFIFVAMCLLCWLPNTISLLIAAVCYGLGFGMVQPALQAWAMSLVPANRRGMANATYFSCFDLGVGLGAVLFGQIGHFFSYQLIYVVSALSCVCALIIFLFFRKVVPQGFEANG